MNEFKVADEVNEDEEYYPYENPVTLADYLYEQGYSDEQVSEAVASYFGWNED